jgi:hypothetical protein
VFVNELGSFIKEDMSFKEIGEMVVARILVSLNIRNGLQKQFNMTNDGLTHTYLLDYEWITFCCGHFHEHGNILRDCHQTFHGKKSNSPPAQNQIRPETLDNLSTSSSHSTTNHSQQSRKKNQFHRAEKWAHALKHNYRLPPDGSHYSVQPPLWSTTALSSPYTRV